MSEIQTIDDVFNAMGDSVGVLNNLVGANVKSLDVYAELSRNIIHLEGMLKQAYIINDGRSLTVYQTAIESAKQFMGIV